MSKRATNKPAVSPQVLRTLKHFDRERAEAGKKPILKPARKKRNA